MAAAAAAVTALSSVKVRASWDTQQRLPYNPHRTYPKNPVTVSPSTSTLKSNSTDRNSISLSLSALLTRRSPTPNEALMEETYLGYETWMPSAPKVEKPRSTYNAAALAYLGDCIYELYARRHFLFPPLNIEEYNERVMAVVRCEAQDAMLQKLINDKVLSEEERDVLRWGKNLSSSSKTRTKKRAGVAVYNRASSLETLVGYLYLTNVNRLDEIMLKIGFSSGVSNQMILEEANIEFN